jgi:DNA-binding transcriptional ArsR family regulator
MIKASYTLFFKALSNDTRLRIIDLLRKGPRNATQIGEALHIEQSMVSHNLACLINCGFVLANQNGRNKVCSLNKQTVMPLLEITDRHIREYGKKLEGCKVLKDIRKTIN